MSNPQVAGRVKKIHFCASLTFFFFILRQEIMNRPLVSSLSGLILKMPIIQASTATQFSGCQFSHRTLHQLLGVNFQCLVSS